MLFHNLSKVNTMIPEHEFDDPFEEPFDFDDLDYDPADVVRFTGDELRVIGRLAQNLLSNAVEVGINPDLLEDIYLKTYSFIDA